ncbi:MAG: DUF4124 domain-containing protein, partial [Pseudomonadota bacterium]
GRPLPAGASLRLAGFTGTRYAWTMRALAALLLLLGCGLVNAEAYRWVDENGVVHYSDRPVAGAERIDIDTDRGSGNRTQIAPPAAPGSSAGTAAQPAAANAPVPTTRPQYQALDLIRPLQGETLWNTGSTLTVSLRVTPSLAPGDRIRLIYDGQQLSGLPTDQLDIQLDEVYRGEHTIQAEIENIDGDTLIQSSVRTFYVRQNSIR